ncbi:Uncharacterized protein FWK35_00027509 [Aphis craccivora]|uniref:Uncharacterized protein n=1 Tax=Aphis craccivora TaxID=307492 RepID=A0A6G0W2G9_APHCR|nr:Uncharacterized protein FWK35_00027509 [Aphis craccivora]
MLHWFIVFILSLRLYIIARLSTSNDSIQIEENKIIAPDKNVSPKNVLDTDPKKKNNHDCNNIKQKAEQEIANLKLEIEKLNFRKNNMDFLLNYFNSKNTKYSSKDVKLGDQS